MKEIELKTKRAMLMLPENCVELKAICTIFEDGKLLEVETLFGIGDIRQAFYDAELNYIEETDNFVVTPKGLEFLKGESDANNY